VEGFRSPTKDDLQWFREFFLIRNNKSKDGAENKKPMEKFERAINPYVLKK